MSNITPISFQALEGLARGKQIGSDTHTVQHSHLLIQNQQGAERISVEDYLLKQAQYPHLPHDTQIEIQLESGHTLKIPLQDLSQASLQSAVKSACSGLNTQLAEQTHRAASPLLTQVRQGGTQVSGPEMLVQFIKLNFQKLDQDGDGWISENEIQIALKSNQYNAAQKSLLNRVLANLSDLEEYSNDEWGDENDGITLADLDLYLEASQNAASSPALQSLSGRVSTADSHAAHAYQIFTRNMHLLDTDHDGYVTSGDLLRASKSKQFSALERSWFAHLAQQVGEIEELSNDEWGDENDGITLRDMEAYLKTNCDHGLRIPTNTSEITGALEVHIHDANGFNQPGRHDISGSISGDLTLNRSVIDHALSQLRAEHIPYVTIKNTSFNPQSKTYEISISTLVDDFKITLGIDVKTGFPYLELSENWLPNDPILQLIQASIEQRLGKTDPLRFEVHKHRIYFIPQFHQLKIPTDNQYLDIDEIKLTKDNVRFAFDSEGNFVLRLRNVEVTGSTDSNAKDEPADTQADRAKIRVRLELDLDQNYEIKYHNIDLDASLYLDLDQQEQQELAAYLEHNLDAELANAFMKLIFENNSKIDLQGFEAGVHLNGREGRVHARIDEQGQLSIFQAGETILRYDLNLLADVFKP